MHKGGFYDAVLNKVKRTYADLCTDENLNKCLHEKTQKASASFNGMVWQRVPKHVHVSLPTLLFGLYDALWPFNDGNRRIADILREAGVKPCHHAIIACYAEVQYRVKKAQRQSSGKAKLQLKKRWTARKAKRELEVSKVGPSYEW